MRRLLFLLALASCGQGPDTPVSDKRFTIQNVNRLGAAGGVLFHVVDTETGAEFLTTHDGGFLTYIPGTSRLDRTK